jgi:predicted nucleotidyltransferase
VVGLAPEAAAAPVAQAAGDFIDSGIPLTGFSNGSAAWGDYDSDGDLDILLAGVSNATITAAKIYQNDGDGIFTNIGAQLPDIDWGSAAWGDYDNDGDLDILLTGFSGVTRVAKIYRNDGPGAGSGWVFTDINAPLTGVSASSRATMTPMAVRHPAYRLYD